MNPPPTFEYDGSMLTIVKAEQGAPKAVQRAGKSKVLGKTELAKWGGAYVRMRIRMGIRENATVTAL